MSARPDISAVFEALDATWAPAEFIALGAWTIRRGAGGGKRVSAATTHMTVTAKDVQAAELAMQEIGQPPLFMLRGEDLAFDALLADLDYDVIDPTIVFSGPCAEIATKDPHRLAAIPCEEPLALMAEIWAAGGIGADRLDVMKRSASPKTYLFSRLSDDAPGGCLFLSCSGKIAMLHALEVLPAARRIGVAQNLILKSAQWAMEHGADTLVSVTTGKNLPAQSLFKNMGMTQVGHYHYRMKSEG